MFPLENIHPSFAPFLGTNASLLESIARQVEKAPFFPAAENVLRFARLDLSQLRVVILGQDPYPQPGAATGRSFEVGTLDSWLGPIRQSSLRSILRAIYASQYGSAPPFSQLRGLIERGQFQILPPGRLWDALEKQGVMFLNAYLTVEPGKPLSHRNLWRPFSEALIKYIDEHVSAAWFLWGGDARSFAPLIKSGRRYESRHPMMCGPWEDDFLKNPCFSETKDIISWTGLGA